MKVHNAIAAALRGIGVDTLFGLMGDANMAYMSDWVEAGGTLIQPVMEAGAVGMADGYSRSTGRLGVVSVTHGPGVTNSLTALTEAVRSNSCVLLLTGETLSKRYQRQELDLRAAAALAGAEYRRVLTPENLVDDLAMAAMRVMSNRTPLLLDIPHGLLLADVDYTRSVFFDPDAASAPAATSPDPDALDRALGVIASARRPIVLAGRGCVGPGCPEALVELANTIGAPVATTLLGRGLFHDHDFNLGIFGTLSHPVATETIGQADCIIAFGASLNHLTTVDNGLLADKRVVHCDSEIRSLGRHAGVDVAVLGDAGAVARAMVSALNAGEIAPTAFRSEALREALSTRNPSDEFEDVSPPGTVDIRSVCVALNSALPPDRLVVTDVGRSRTMAWPYLHVTHPRDFAHAGNFGSIGLGTAVALGASVANPNRLTVSVVGDAGGAMAFSEFMLAVRHRLKFVSLMFNDGAYGAEYQKLPEYDIDPKHSLIQWPSFADVAKAYGGHSMVVRTMDDLDKAVAMIENEQLPLLIEVMVDPAIKA